MSIPRSIYAGATGSTIRPSEVDAAPKPAAGPLLPSPHAGRDGVLAVALCDGTRRVVLRKCDVGFEVYETIDGRVTWYGPSTPDLESAIPHFHNRRREAPAAVVQGPLRAAVGLPRESVASGEGDLTHHPRRARAPLPEGSRA